MSTSFFPLAVWSSGTNQNSIPANDNALRLEAKSREIISQAVTAQPASPADGDTYIIASTHTGTQWATFSPKDIAIYRGGTWYAWAPVEGLIVNVAGSQYKYDGGVWVAVSAGGGSAPIVQSITSSATPTPTFADDILKITAQAAAAAIANPTGTAVDSKGYVIRIKDNGTARALTWGTQYRGIGVSLPSTTVIGKTLYIAWIWNVEDTKADVVAVAQEA
jgi:hypothetical protein